MSFVFQFLWKVDEIHFWFRYYKRTSLLEKSVSRLMILDELFSLTVH